MSLLDLLAVAALLGGALGVTLLLSWLYNRAWDRAMRRARAEGRLGEFLLGKFGGEGFEPVELVNPWDGGDDPDVPRRPRGE